MSSTLCRRSFHAFLFLFAAFVLVGADSFGQINSLPGTVTLNATLAETLTIAATPATVTFTLVGGGTATASAPVAITTTWQLGASRSNVKVYSWFATPIAALTDGLTTPNNIPSSEVYGLMTTGTPTTYTAYTQTNTMGTAAGGLLLFTQVITSLNRAATRSDNLSLEINLTSQAQLPAGSYSGTLNILAQAL